MSAFHGARLLIIFVTVLLFRTGLVIFIVFVFVIFFLVLLLFIAELEAIVVLELLERLDSRGEADRLEALLEGLFAGISTGF